MNNVLLGISYSVACVYTLLNSNRERQAVGSIQSESGQNGP